METDPVDAMLGLALARVVMREIYPRDEEPSPPEVGIDPAGILAYISQHEFSGIWAFWTLRRVAATYHANQKRLGLPRLLDAIANRIEYEGEPISARH